MPARRRNHIVKMLHFQEEMLLLLLWCLPVRNTVVCVIVCNSHKIGEQISRNLLLLFRCCHKVFREFIDVPVQLRIYTILCVKSRTMKGKNHPTEKRPKKSATLRAKQPSKMAIDSPINEITRETTCSFPFSGNGKMSPDCTDIRDLNPMSRAFFTSTPPIT